MSDAINTMRPRDSRVRCSNRQYYTMRTVPDQTADRAVRGGMLELLPAAQTMAEPPPPMEYKAHETA